jgi:hypothetical protein
MFILDNKSIIIEGEKLKTSKGTDDVITEIVKQIIPASVRGKISSKRDRQLLLEKFGSKSFLDPNNLKFPVINPTTGKYDCSLIYAAKIRSKQYLGLRPGYREIYNKASELFKRHHCGEKLHIKIQEGDTIINTTLSDLMEILF